MIVNKVNSIDGASIRYQTPRLRPRAARVPRPLEAVPYPIGRLSVREELKPRRLKAKHLLGVLDISGRPTATVFQRCLDFLDLAYERGAVCELRSCVYD